MGSPGCVKAFLRSCHVGFYLRVLEEDEVGAGDPIERVSTDPEQMKVREVCHLLYFDSKNLEEAQKALRIQALSPGWRGAFEERLAKEGIPIKDTEEPRQEDDCCGPGV
jgi:MOSC domain-containing protein YiiM